MEGNDLGPVFAEAEKVYQEGKTPLIIDRSEAKVVDTVMSLEDREINCKPISAKRMIVERTKDKKPVEEILEDARVNLVTAVYTDPYTDPYLTCSICR